jgi:undecaprenyl-diphosphatase
VFGIVAWFAWHHGRRDAALILGGLVVAMGPARVLASAHLPSDVLGGYLLGGAWLLVVLAIHDGLHIATWSAHTRDEHAPPPPD